VALIVTITDTETGKTQTEEVEDDYLVITHGNREVANTQVFKTGTHQITIRVHDPE
jgi:hypothetical protein